MKTIILAVLLMTAGVFASEIHMLEGDEAYKLYLSLKGVRCTEWNSKDLVVYTKYSTSSCDDQGDNTQWTCTVQINKMDRQKQFESASCSREIP